MIQRFGGPVTCPGKAAHEGGVVVAAIVVMPAETFELHFPAAQLERLHRLCRVLEPLPCLDLTDRSLAARLVDVELALTGWRSPHLGAALLELMPRLRLVAHTAGTVRNVASPALLRRGVRVTQAAEANARPVAEYTLGVILLANKAFLTFARAFADARGDFRPRQHRLTAAVGNRGRTIGIVGASRVGRLVLELLQRHELELLLADPFVGHEDARALGARLVSLAELLRASDVVSLHQPLLPETRGSIGRAELASMRDGALLINTARGAIIDHAALVAELATGRIQAVLDVTDPEPLPADSPLWTMPNVVVTPHIAGSMGNEVERMTELALDEVERFVLGAPLQHEVTLEQWERLA